MSKYKDFSTTMREWRVIAAMERLIDLDSRQVRSVLHILLKDRTTGHNIIWATDTYAPNGEEYSAKKTISAALVTGENSNIIQPRIAKTADDQADRTKKRAEVFTPAWICNLMNNHCDEVYFKRKKDLFNVASGTSWTANEQPIRFVKGRRWQAYIDSRRLEITCGEAPYLVSRYDASTGEMIPFARRIGMLDRKFRVLNENAADEKEWLKYAYHALQSIYGYEYQGDNLLIARVNVLMAFMDAMQEKWQREPTEQELLQAAEIISWNIWQMDGLKGTVPVDALYAKEQQLSIFSEIGMPEQEEEAQQCRIMNWRDGHKLAYIDRKRPRGKNKEAAEMKFDFVIGNPPYQETQEATSDKPVYNYFMDASYKVADRVELITPARFLFNAGKTPKAWNEKMLSDPHLRVLWYEQDSSKVFANTDIKGGVAITYRDATVDSGAIGVFSSFPELNTILRKVRSTPGFRTLDDLIVQQNKWNLDALYAEHPEYREIIGSKGTEKRLTTPIFSAAGVFTESKKHDDDLQVIGLIKNVRYFRFVAKRFIDQNHANLYKYKVIVPASNGSGAIGEVLSTPLIGEPLIGYTQSFIGFGYFDTKVEAEAACKYIKTKLARTMLGTLKITQHNHKGTWINVPLQDFTPASDIDWSVSIAEIDRQLYKKYNLSEAEITFIETKVKEMA